jgi:glutathione synthase/RimK-type ligase-like ATP-grasp enzyme
MPKKILILCRKDDRESYDNRENMVSGLKKHAKTARYFGAYYEDLLFAYDGKKLTITDINSQTDITNYDSIFMIGWFKTKSLNDVALAVARYAKHNNIPFANAETYFNRSFTKLSQCVVAALNGLPVIPFLFSLDQQLLLDNVKKRVIAAPYIAKAVSASRGDDNYLVGNHDQLAKLIAEPSRPRRYFMVQDFVPNDGDYRVLVMNGAVELVVHRQSQDGSHINNTSKGGRATLVPVDQLHKKVLEDSIKISRHINREITGVDMVRHNKTGEFYFLEVNNMPQLATGSFVDKKLERLSAQLEKYS